MKNETIAATIESAEHWERMAEYDPRDFDKWPEEPYSHDCALCDRFWNDGRCELDGERCPVLARTGEQHCSNFAEYTTAATGVPNKTKEQWRAEALAVAQALRAMIPTETQGD